MAPISFLFFQCKIALNVLTCHAISNISQLLLTDHLKIANCSNLTIAFYHLGNFGQALCIRSCHKDLILTRRSNNCFGIAFIQGDSAGGSKFIEQTIATALHDAIFFTTCVATALRENISYDYMMRFIGYHFI